MFENRWALVTAGMLDDFNTCTLIRGGMEGQHGALMVAIVSTVTKCTFIQRVILKVCGEI